MTPLVHAKKLGAKLGLDNLYIKNDSVNPTFSSSVFIASGMGRILMSGSVAFRPFPVT